MINIGKLSYGVTVLGHLIVAGVLYFGVYGSDDDPKNWDMQQLVGTFTIFLYIGGYSSTWIRKFVEKQTGVNLSKFFYTMAITLPTLSVIFSLIGIGAAIFFKGHQIIREKDNLYLTLLYVLNVLFIGLQSQSLGLWSFKAESMEKEISFDKGHRGQETIEETSIPSSSKAHED